MRTERATKDDVRSAERPQRTKTQATQVGWSLAAAVALLGVTGCNEVSGAGATGGTGAAGIRGMATAGTGGMAGSGGDAGGAGDGGAGGMVDLCVGVSCDDENDCTIDDVCVDGECVFSAVLDGTACDFGGAPGVCNSGMCEDAMLCSDAATRCDDDNQCTTDTCNPDDGICTNAPRTGLCSSSIEGLGSVVADCIGGVCEQRFCDFNNDCNDNLDCTTDLCDAFTNRCTNPDAPSGTSCNGGAGRCFAGGICIPDVIIGF